MCQGSGKEGFTLVEVMVSLVIFLIASMGLLPLLLTNIQVNHDNSRNAQARRLAGEVMAEFQVIDYAGLPLAAEVPLLVGDLEVQPLVERDVPHPGQSRITVSAGWQQRGENHRYRLQTVRTAP
ncbi:type II secretion system protein [Deltaproteobacteria bacterium IMCC39524]|nr:type II secretion system protein [Deltaproteobacteria bacterium IMCC39524]